VVRRERRSRRIELGLQVDVQIAKASDVAEDHQMGRDAHAALKSEVARLVTQRRHESAARGDEPFWIRRRLFLCQHRRGSTYESERCEKDQPSHDTLRVRAGTRSPTPGCRSGATVARRETCPSACSRSAGPAMTVWRLCAGACQTASVDGYRPETVTL